MSYPPRHAKHRRPIQTRSQRSRRRVAIAVSAALAAGTFPMSAAIAQTHTDHPSAAQQLQKQLNRLDNRAERLTERYNGERLALHRAKVRERRIAVKLRHTRYELRLLRGQVGASAATQYMYGGHSQGTAAMAGGRPQQVIDRMATLDHLDHNSSVRLHRLLRAEHRLAAQERTAKRQTHAIHRIVAKLDKQKRHIKALVRQIKAKLAKQRHEEHGRQPAGRQAPHVTPSSPAKAVHKTADSTASTASSGVKATGKAAVALRAALGKRGRPYVWGASGPSSFDCSGLTMWAYKQAGVNLPHFTGAQYNAGRHVSRSQLHPGDLVFFYADHHHVGMYVGAGKMVDAPHTGDVVKVESFGNRPFSGGVRVVH